MLHLLHLKDHKNGIGTRFGGSSHFWRGFQRERALLSRFAHDPTVGGLRDKKEKCSTRNRLRVDSGIESFFKLLEVGFSPYLSFYSHLNVLLMFRLNEAVRGRLIGPKTWDRIYRNFERKMEQPVATPRLP